MMNREILRARFQMEIDARNYENALMVLVIIQQYDEVIGDEV